MTSNDISSCIKEMQDVIRLRQLQILEKEQAGKDATGADKTDSSISSSGASGGNPPNLDRCLSLLRSLFDLERLVDRVPLGPIQNMGSAVGKVFKEGRWLLDRMEEAGFRIELVITKCYIYSMCII